MFWDRKNCRWRSQVGYQNRKIFMGYFNDAEAAARAYDRKLVELHGALGGWRVDWGRAVRSLGARTAGGMHACGCTLSEPHSFVNHSLLP